MNVSWRSLAVALTLLGCANRETTRRVAGGDPERGRALIKAYGCGSCHTIPGVRGANSYVGPSLDGVASRAYIAGVLPNDPENMVRWIENPPAIDAKTAMPYLHVSARDARDIAEYLYRLRARGD